mgnify:CR=1 FL=1
MTHIQKRIEALRQTLKKNKLDGFLIFSVEGSDAANLRYLTGFGGSFGVLIVSEDRQIFFTDSRYIERVRNDLRGFEVEELNARKERASQKAVKILKALKLKRVGFNSLTISVAVHNDLNKRLKGKGMKLVPLDGVVEKLRRIKDEQEISNIARAVELTDQAYAHILNQIKVGMTESEVAWELEKFIRENGSDGLAFPIIVASGPNSALPHHSVSDRKIQRGDFLLFDFAARYNGYCADMTRTVVVGQPSEEQQKIYKIVLEAQERAIEKIRAGIKGKDADKAARGVIEQAGYGENFGHGTGHGIGLAVHEGPRLSALLSQDKLKPGMVVTVEPGIYLPNWGGVRIEDLVVVEEDRCRVLTRSPKRELQVI